MLTPESKPDPVLLTEDDIVIGVTKADLVRALHLMLHEHGDLWSPTDGCGCSEWADTLWMHLDVGS